MCGTTIELENPYQGWDLEREGYPYIYLDSRYKRLARLHKRLSLGSTWFMGPTHGAAVPHTQHYWLGLILLYFQLVDSFLLPGVNGHHAVC
jgi:hypothetical protein